MTLPPALAPFSKLIAVILGAIGTSVASGGDWRVVVASVITAVLVFFFPKNTDK